MKTVLITGANTGIGAASARQLAAKGFRVFFACRSEAKTRPVMDGIAKAVPGAQLHFLELALDDLASVRRAADEYLARQEPLDVLLLNAGLVRVKGLTRQGFEPTFGVNHLGHFVLTLRLKAALEAGKPSRVVTVASRAHERTRRPLDFSTFTKPTQSVSGWPEYQQSKLANVLFTRELARRWSGTGITACSLHPGVIASDIWRAAPWPLRPLVKRFMKTPEEGATASVHLSSADAASLTNGGYYGEAGEPRAMNPLALDDQAARALWEESARLAASFVE